MKTEWGRTKSDFIQAGRLQNRRGKPIVAIILPAPVQQSPALLLIKFAITYCKKTSYMNFSEYVGSDWKYLKVRILR